MRHNHFPYSPSLLVTDPGFRSAQLEVTVPKQHQLNPIFKFALCSVNLVTAWAIQGFDPHEWEHAVKIKQKMMKLSVSNESCLSLQRFKISIAGPPNTIIPSTKTQ